TGRGPDPLGKRWVPARYEIRVLSLPPDDGFTEIRKVNRPGAGPASKAVRAGRREDRDLRLRFDLEADSARRRARPLTGARSQRDVRLIQLPPDRGSFNGRTEVFEASDRGSSPRPRAAPLASRRPRPSPCRKPLPFALRGPKSSMNARQKRA